MSPPKLFVSYCWSSHEHEQWVVDLATELRESGIDVTFDKWDLKEGHDAIAFMEKMVTDPEIKKVVMICDEKYARKADDRSGGVGTETQIISREVYEKQDQNKFVAVLSARDAEGKPYLPTYYKSRIFVDLSDAERYAPEFEKLLRWIFDKPLYVKPEVGALPGFLDEGDHVSLGTSAAFRRCLDAIKNQKAYAAGAFDEYCNIFTANLERFRVPHKPRAPFDDDAIMKSIEDFLPYRNEALRLILTIAQYSPTQEFTSRIHRLLEGLLPYTSRPPEITSSNDWDFDNYRFIVYELFVYTLAILIKHERFDQAAYLLSQQYYVRQQIELGLDPMMGFGVFQQTLGSFDQRNQRLGLRKVSLRAMYLKERCVGVGIEFADLMQADFVAFMRAEIDATNTYCEWVPDTLVYRDRSRSPFEIFARSVSMKYFQRVNVLLGITSPTGLEILWQKYKSGTRQLPRLNMYSAVEPLPLLAYNKWATKA
jgi:TIR domain